MTTTNTTTAVNTISDVETTANDARRIWDAAVIAERATWPGSDMQAVKAAHAAERVANAAWKAAERALSDMWRAELARDEELRLQAMCEEHDAMEEEYSSYDVDYMYHLTPTGEQYLDHHYQNDSEGAILALDGDSPYGDGTTGWDQPTPAHPCYTNGVADMDELIRLENLSY